MAIVRNNANTYPTYLGIDQHWSYTPHANLGGGGSSSGSFIMGSAYGVVGDGITDDTAAMQLAIDTGKSVDFGYGTFLTSAPLTINTWGQEIRFQGRSKFAVVTAGRGGACIKSYHSGDTFRIGTLAGAKIWGVRICNVWIQGNRTQTAAYVFNINNADHTVIDYVLMQDVGPVGYVNKSNWCVFDNIWASGSLPSAHWFYFDGRVNRSDIVTISNSTIGDTFSSGTAMSLRPWGIEWDGNFQTVHVTNVAFVGVRGGIWTRNTNAQAFPTGALFGQDVEFDHTYNESLRFECGDVLEIDQIYINAGSANVEHNVYIGPLVKHVAITGGQNYAWWKSAIFCEGTDCVFTGVWNGGGSQQGLNVWPSVYFSATAARCQVIGGAAGHSGGSVGNNSYGVDVGAGATEISVVGVALDGATASYRTATASALTVVGCTNASTVIPGDLNTTRLLLDTQYYATVSGVNAVINFDSGDLFRENRTTNSYEWLLGNGVQATLNASYFSTVSTSAASSTTTGALRIAGGAGIAGQVFMGLPPVLPGYTFATVPAAAGYVGGTLRITDRSQRLATSDGTNWRFMDGVIIT